MQTLNGERVQSTPPIPSLLCDPGKESADPKHTPPLLHGYCMTTMRGKPALEVWSKKEAERLFHHLHNENSPFSWVMGFRDKNNGQKRYTRSRNVPVNRGITWALATMDKRYDPEKSLAFVPYSTNDRQMSRWGGFDFDAHNGEFERARAFAFEAFRLLLNCEEATILESSGSGGWHVWSISKEFKPVSHWIRLLKGIARDIGATVASGVCEIFPPDTLNRGFGKGMRAPGTWNPGTNSFSEILYQNANELIEGLPIGVSGNSPPIRKLAFSASVGFSIEKEISISLLSFSQLCSIIGGGDYAIDRVSTRHEKLSTLTGSAFLQVSRTVAEAMAKAQYAEKMVSTRASSVEHLAEFESLWAGLERRWISSLTASEKERFETLSTENERSAFRIIKNFAGKAVRDELPDFHLPRDNLASRLAITPQGAGKLRKKFEALGIISLTKRHQPNATATRYRWNAITPFETHSK